MPRDVDHRTKVACRQAAPQPGIQQRSFCCGDSSCRRSMGFESVPRLRPPRLGFTKGGSPSHSSTSSGSGSTFLPQVAHPARAEPRAGRRASATTGAGPAVSIGGVLSFASASATEITWQAAPRRRWPLGPRGRVGQPDRWRCLSARRGSAGPPSAGGVAGGK